MARTARPCAYRRAPLRTEAAPPRGTARLSWDWEPGCNRSGSSGALGDVCGTGAVRNARMDESIGVARVGAVEARHRHSHGARLHASHGVLVAEAAGEADEHPAPRL